MVILGDYVCTEIVVALCVVIVLRKSRARSPSAGAGINGQDDGGYLYPGARSPKRLSRSSVGSDSSDGGGRERSGSRRQKRRDRRAPSGSVQQQQPFLEAGHRRSLDAESISSAFL